MQKKLNNLFGFLLSFPRYAKILIALINDITLCVISLWIAFYLRLDAFVPLRDNILWTALISTVAAISIFWLTGFYKTVFRYSGKSTLASVGFSILIYSLIFISIVTIYGIKDIPRSIGILQPLVLFFAICGSRLGAMYILGNIDKNNSNPLTIPKALIYGAGSAGRQLVSALENSNEMKVVGFIDDDEFLHGQVLQGLKIYKPGSISNIILSKKVTHVLLAIPSVNRSKRMKIIKNISKYKVKVKTLPSVLDMVEDRVTISDIRELEVEDILGRDQILPNNQLLNKNVNSKVVLVTGAGGSIGSELCRQIIKLNPYKLIILDISEYSLYKIHMELEDIKVKMSTENHIDIIPLITSVQNESWMQKIISTFQPDTIYHAAAYKHVPLVEENVCEGLKNNVFGSLNLAKLAISEKVSSFVLVSSDKAVRPTNVMGASKRLAELCLQALFNNSTNSFTKLCMVRFGNVLNSSGSVIPKFKKQIREGGPVTLTHPDVTRYFMTIPEAVQLVIQAGALAKGSDVFVLDMGKPVKIKNLIERIINLSGLSIQNENNPDGDISIKVIGLRPAEKLYEELLLGDDPQPTLHPKIKKAQDPYIPLDKLQPKLDNLKDLLNNGNVNEAINLIKEIVIGYKWDGKIVDQLYMEQKKTHNKKSHLTTKNRKIDQKVIKIRN